LTKGGTVTRFWDFFEEQAGGLFLLLSVLLVFGQIVARFVFNYGVSGLYELATYSAIYSVFLTSSVAIKNNIHIRIDLLANVVSQRRAFWLEIITMVIVGVVSGALCWSGILLVKESHMLGEQTIGTISIAVWIIQLILPLAGALMLMRTLQRLLILVRTGPSRYKVEGPSELEFL
jgi:C4-dicarboxylate transporter, DctQ subunit